MAATFESLLEKEFAEVQKAREEILAKQAELNKDLHAVEERFTRLKNAQAALQGKLVIGAPPEPKARRTRTEKGSRAPRGSREQIKAQVIELLKQKPTGLVSSQISDALPEHKAQLHNVLSILKADGKIKQDAKRGPYYLSSEAA